MTENINQDFMAHSATILNQTVHERLTAIQFLNNISANDIHWLENLCAKLGMPNGNFAGKKASLSFKVQAILEWWLSPAYKGELSQLVALAQLAKFGQELSDMPNEQFNEVISDLRIEQGSIPGSQALREHRVIELLLFSWKKGIHFLLDQAIERNY